jgi:hypothetical protein
VEADMSTAVSGSRYGIDWCMKSGKYANKSKKEVVDIGFVKEVEVKSGA